MSTGWSRNPLCKLVVLLFDPAVKAPCCSDVDIPLGSVLPVFKANALGL